MSYNTDHLYPMSAEDVDSALSSFSIRAAHHQEGWRLLMAIKTRSGLVGRIFDRRSVEAVQKAAELPQLVNQYNGACDHLSEVRRKLSSILVYVEQR